MHNATIMVLCALAHVFVLSGPQGIARQGNTKQLSDAFDKLLSEQFKPGEPGVAVVIARGDNVIYRKAFGMANLELNVPMQHGSVFRIGSITKQFTAVAILQLVERGKLSLNDEITRFIPDYPTQGYRITIEHLLTHTSGIRNYSGIKDTARKLTGDVAPVEVIEHFKHHPMRFAPGTKWEYSNSGYFLLGYIIEIITGKTYGDYLDENIFKPLGMAGSLYTADRRLIKNRAAGYSKGDHGFENAAYISLSAPYAAGGIQSTVGDLLTWNRAVHSLKLISKDALRKALSRHQLSDGTETQYGYGWRFGYIRESPSIWHGGLINGFITMSMYLPQEDVFVAVFSNCDCNSPEDITAKLAAHAIGKPYEFIEVPVDSTRLAQYAGVYENGKGQQRVITVSDNRLYSQRGRGPTSLIKAYEPDKFFVADNVMVTMEFARTPGGTISSLIVRSRVANDTWVRTDKPIPSGDGIQLDDTVKALYLGEYEITPELTFVVTIEKSRLFVQATGQEKFEIFAGTESKFFTKVNDAQIEFIRDESGKVSKATIAQAGRTTDARKIR